MKKILVYILLSVVSCIGVSSCSDVDIPEAANNNLEKVSNLTYSAKGRDVTLAWSLPTSADVSGVTITKNNGNVISVNSPINSYLLKHVDTGVDLTYTVKARYNIGMISKGQSVKFNIPSSGETKVGLLISYNSISDIQDDDEKAAVEWFQKTYPSGVILTPADLDNLYPDEISCIWIQIDRIGLSVGYNNLPASLVSSSAINALTNYVKQGGNLLLTKQATQLVSAIGRIDNKYAPGIFGSGDGGQGSDIWTTNAVIGSGLDMKYDHTTHALFKNLTVLPAKDEIDNYDHASYPLEGAGWREDHNCMWDLNAYGFTTADGNNVVEAWQNKTNSTVLATWGQVVDYCCAGIVEFNPTSDYLGRIITIGLSCYEFNQNTGNTYQSNIEKLTSNSINYLK